MALSEKVSYLKGLAEGLKISEESNEGKLLMEIIKALELFADEFNEQQGQLDELDDYVSELDEDLEALEDSYYEDEDEDEDECCCDGEGCDCSSKDFDDNFEEIVCPKCHEVIRFEGDIEEEDELRCPVCDEILINNEEVTPEE